MKVREAVSKARAFVKELYAEEPIGDLGVEEIELDDDPGTELYWRVTVGFIRLWDRQIPDQETTRYYKQVVIENSTGDVVGLKNRQMAVAKR